MTSDPKELMARVRAAAGYSGLKRDAFAAKVAGISASQIDLWKGKRATGAPPSKLNDYVRLAAASDLPVAFFFADFDFLGEHLREDTPEEVRRYIAGEEVTRRARARAQAAGRRLAGNQPASPSAHGDADAEDGS